MGMYTLLYLKWITNRDLLYTAHGTLQNVMWQPGWEGSLGENGYMYMYDWVSLLFTWNYHNIVNWLSFQYKIKSFKKGSRNLDFWTTHISAHLKGLSSLSLAAKYTETKFWLTWSKQKYVMIPLANIFEKVARPFFSLFLECKCNGWSLSSHFAHKRHTKAGKTER